MPSRDIIEFLRDRDPDSGQNLVFRKVLLLLAIKEAINEILEIDKKLYEKGDSS